MTNAYMKTAENILKILIVTVLSLLSLISCKKDDTQVFEAYFYNVGGWIEGPIGHGYEIDIEGESLMIEIDGSQALSTEENNRWYAELDWLKAEYVPRLRVLNVVAGMNDTNQIRKATITGHNESGRQLIVKIYQDN